MSSYGGSDTIRGGSTHDPAESTPEILCAKRGTVDVAKSPIWELVPGSVIVGLAFARVPGPFLRYVRCEPIRRGNSGTRRSNDQVRICSRRWFCRSDRLLLCICIHEPGLSRHSVVRAHRYQSVMHFRMTWCPFQDLQDVLYALFQVECAEVETAQTAFFDKAPNHLDSQRYAIVFNLLVVMLI
jgi:hypothetical protein